MADITAQQWTSFRNAVKAHAADAVATAYQAKDVDALAAWYNGASVTKLWRSDVQPRELIGAVVMSEFLANGFITAGKQNGMLLLMQLGASGLDATLANVRTSFSTVWSGTTTLTNLTAIAQRVATQFEAIAAYLTPAAPANVCAPEVYGHVLDRSEVARALWDDAGNPL